MKRLLLYLGGLFIPFLCSTSVSAQAPGISYTPATSALLVGVPFSVSPVNTGGSVPATVYGTVSTFAGSTAGTAGLTNATGTAARFNLPRSISIDNTGTQYICDAGNNEIRQATAAGAVTLMAGSATGASGLTNGSGTAALFNLPYNATADGAGNLYIADFSNNEIREMVISTGAVTLLAGSATGVAGMANGTGTAATFNNPPGIVYNPVDGNLYVTDFNNSQIRKVTPAGVVTLLAGSTTGATGTTNGTGTAARFNGPNGIAVDAAGNLYVADQNNNEIRKVTTAGVVTLFAGSTTGATGTTDGLGTLARFNTPRGVTVDPSGNLYITDSGNNTLRLITPTGLVTTFAGNTTAGYTDAVGTAAQFNQPRGLDCDPVTGNLYIADYTNNVIRQVITTGYLISATLPAGLSFDNTTGIISGTPTATFGSTTYTIIAFNATGSSSTTVTLSCTAPTINSWKGSGSTAWSTAANWTGGHAPLTTETAEIGVVAYTGPANQPTITASTTVKALVFGTHNTPTLTINSGQTLTVSNGVGVNAASTATIKGPGTLSLAGTGSFITSGGSLTASSNLAITLAANSQLVNYGTFTLASDINGSSYITAIPSTSSISGTVSVQRYITKGAFKYRGYRLLSSPVHVTTDAYSNQVYSINYLSSSTFLTGTDGVAGGFDKAGNPTLYLYRENFNGTNISFTSGNYRGVKDINQSPAYNYLIDGDAGTFNIPAGNGVLFFFRGSRSTVNPYTVTTSPLTTTFTATGTLNQGQIIVSDWFTPSTNFLSYTSTTTVAGFNLVGNPYPSSIDRENFQTAGPNTTGIYGVGVSTTIYMLDPISHNYGAYTKGSGGVGTNNASNIIVSGQGFFVRASSTTAQLYFNESAKTTAQNIAGSSLLMGSPVAASNNQYLHLILAKDSVNTDETMIRFNSQAGTSYNQATDAIYEPGFGAVSLSTLSSDNVNMAIDVLPLPKLQSESIGLNVNVNTDGAYSLTLKDVVAVPPLFEIWLIDAYKKDSLDIRNNLTYSFNVYKSDTNSFGSKRFKLVIRQNPGYAYQLVSFTAAKVQGVQQVQINWNTINEGNYTNFTVQRSVDGGKTFDVLGGVTASGVGQYNLVDRSPVLGQNLYRLQQQDINNTITYSNVVTIQYSDVSNGIGNNVLSIYPNPVQDNISLNIAGQSTDNDSYNIKFMNSSGIIVKQVTSGQTSWQGSVSNLQPGTYIVQVLNNKNDTLVGQTKFVKL